jgi:hypothetical protein
MATAKVEVKATVVDGDSVGGRGSCVVLRMLLGDVDVA